MPIISPFTLSIHTPDNCLVRFENTHVHTQEDCIIDVSRCLPAYLSSDINFQLEKTLGEGDEIPDDETYVLKMLSDCDADNILTIELNNGSTTEIFATISWQLNEDGTKAIGFLTKSTFAFSNFMHSMDCFVLGIFGTSSRYTYGSFAGTAYGIMTISIVINGDTESVTVGALSLQGIADALSLLLTNDEWIVDGNDIYADNVSGDVYGTITIDDGRLTPYEPVITENEDDLIGCSNCFEVVKDTCFTTVLKYRCAENSFGFDYETALIYEPDFYNIIRLPIFINNPQQSVEETVFALSDGSRKQLSARFSKEFEGHVDWLDEATHDRIAIALKHDEVWMKRPASNVFTQYVSEGKYDIAWQNVPGVNVDSAPAEFKVKETPYFSVNSNCQ